MDAKNQVVLNALIQKHASEKERLLDRIQQLEKQKVDVLTGRRSAEECIEAVQEELEMAQKEINEEEFIKSYKPPQRAALNFPSDEDNLQKQINLLSTQLKEAEKEQENLKQLQHEHEMLKHEKFGLENLLEKLQKKLSDGDNDIIKSQMAKIHQLNEDKKSLQAQLDQASNQIMAASTAMALAQSHFTKELEAMKQNSPSLSELENYAQLQLNNLDQQRQILELQDAIKKHESIVDKLLKDGDVEKENIIKAMETKVKAVQDQLQSTQDLFTRQKEKCEELGSANKKKVLLLKDLHAEIAHLMTSLAESEERRRQSERMERKLFEKCESYKKTLDRINASLAR
uniref:Uncharacterized protein n=1 Tax=Biomphalaria glabrata TaxID=6526 RepID=A0A2C9L0Q2_BIOGL